MRGIGRCARCLALLLLLCLLPAVAWPSVEPPPAVLLDADATRAPDQPFEIELPRDWRGEVALELDRIDVTAWCALDDWFLRFTPPVPLGTGAHELVLLEVVRDGSVRERGRWSFDVRPALGAGLELGGGGTFTTRPDDDGLNDAPSRAHGALDAEGHASFQAEGTRIEANAIAIYDSNGERVFDGRDVHLGEYQIEASTLTSRASEVTARLGHHAPTRETLVTQALRRRGASLEVGFRELGIRTTGFMIEGSDQLGGRDLGLGLDDSDDWIAGVDLEGRRPLGNSWEFGLGFLYLEGEASDDGGGLSGLSGDPRTQRGSAWSARGDLAHTGGRLNLFGEYASSDLDESTSALAQRDHAYHLGTSLRPFRALRIAGHSAEWTLSVDGTRFGTHFRSLGAAGQTRDRKGATARSQLYWRGLGVDLTYGHERDNVEGLKILPELELNYGRVATHWNPDFELEAEVWKWIGRPSVRFDAAITETRVDSDPADLLEQGLLYETSSWSAGAGLGFARNRFSWGVGHLEAADRVRSSALGDERTRVSEAYAQYSIGSVSLGTHYRVDQRRKRRAPNRRVHLLQGDVAWAGTNGLRAHLNATFERGREADVENQRSWWLSGGAQWNVPLGDPNWPDLSLGIDATWFDRDDDLEGVGDVDRYELFMRLHLGWTRAWGTLR